MRVGVLIPAYNEEGTIFSLIKDLLALFADRQDLVEEIIVIDDGSTDNTRREAEKAGARVVFHPENRGKGAALNTGFQYALQRGFEAVITMDGDGQHDGAEIPAFLEKAQEKEAHIIIGNRMGNVENMPQVRFWTNRTTSRVVSALAHQKIDDSQSGYRLIKKEAFQNINLVTSNFDAESEILVKASRQGYKITSVPIKTIYMDKFSSKIKPFQDTLRFIRLVVRLWFFK
ncbi:glycosyltransferase family 2 protein [candidate division NPL-UPA2 bacterium]|nr:glycosyltransferase family 2 protein [candidate division NPL-UPA2 bacterium]